MLDPKRVKDTGKLERARLFAEDILAAEIVRESSGLERLNLPTLEPQTQIQLSGKGGNRLTPQELRQVFRLAKELGQDPAVRENALAALFDHSPADQLSKISPSVTAGMTVVDMRKAVVIVDTLNSRYQGSRPLGLKRSIGLQKL